MYGVVLIGVMVIVGGAIAFIGDKLGTKIGKKRLSIFGLRPRHTSIIITIITGILITGLSIGAMAFVSKDVRTALFGMEELNAAITSTRAALAQATQELLEMQNEFERADAELGNARSEIANLKIEQQELEKESARLREGNDRLEQEKAELTAQNENLSGINENLTAANQDLSNTNQELTNTNSELENSNKQLSEFNVTLTADNEKLTKDNAALEEHAQNLRAGLIAIREGDIVFRAGEVLASAVIKGNRPLEEVSEDMNRLANAASRNIAERFGENEGDSSLWIYQPEFQQALETISESRQDMVVRISAAGNLVRGEPVRTSISLYPNEKIYNSGEYIFSHEYEVASAEDAESIVRNFLTEVNYAAISKGILPDPLTGNVGVMEGSQLYELFDELSKIHGKVKLTARTREEIYSIGPLRLNIKLEQKGKNNVYRRN